LIEIPNDEFSKADGALTCRCFLVPLLPPRISFKATL